MEWGKSLPDVWIEPENSVILQVNASRMVITDTFATTHELRSPILVAIRDDKNVVRMLYITRIQRTSK